MASLRFDKLHDEVLGFTCGNGSIDAQIEHAHFLTDNGIAHAYEVTAENIGTIGYYCLRMREIRHEFLPAEIGDIDIGVPFCFYAVEIKFLAVRKDLQKNRLGTAILQVVIENLKGYHNDVPFRFIYIDALREKIAWYERFGFRHFAGRASEDITTPMYLDLSNI